ncbi:unnamed protein product [Pleuronectes platessa]|uniref:Uncharacterized protein n=1 Tax=Pleuronectes platessa TaxID=8262 RepID=A0A9N7Z3W1_PLEPL|nr:unnamed protein product [Pleuronectes platessa]
MQFLNGIQSVLPRLWQLRGPERDDSAPGESLSRSRRVALSVPRTLGSKMAGCGFEEAAVAERGNAALRTPRLSANKHVSPPPAPPAPPATRLEMSQVRELSGRTTATRAFRT